MARNVSDEELQLKKRARRRLVGAIVLVTAVAVVLPMILDSEPKPVSQNIDIQIPSPNAGLLTKPPVPLKPVEQPAKAEAPSQPQPEPKTEAAPPAKAETKPRPAAKPAPKPESAAKPKAATKTADAGGFVIQVVALADAARAKQLQEKIAAGGLKAYTEVVQTEKGPVTRVRVGPYASREAAESGRKQLQRLELDGKVVPR